MSRYLGLFLSESREHLEEGRGLARRLEQNPADTGALQGLFRHAHSLKGMAATMGFSPIVELSHALEGLLDFLRTAPVPAEPDAGVAQALECLERMLAAVERGEPPQDRESETLIGRLKQSAGARTTGATPQMIGREDLPEVPASSKGSGPKRAPQKRRSTWRLAIELDRQAPLPAASVTRLLSRLGELGQVLGVNPPLLTPQTGRFSGRVDVILDSRRTARGLTTAVRRFPEVHTVSISQEPPREPIDPAGPRTSPKWVRVRSDLMDELLESTLELMLEQRRLAAALRSGEASPDRHVDRCDLLLRELYGDLMELRMVPFGFIDRRLSGSVEELARQLGKRVDFVLEGREVRLDRSILDTLVEPLMHMLRNSLDHGIETPAQRRRAGKPAVGRIRLRLERQGDRLTFQLEDDGRGLDAAVLRKTAVERGLLDPQRAASLSDEEARMLVTLPGFSTVREAGRVSGRGVGLDVARHCTESLGGSLRIHSDPPNGTSVHLSLPMTLAVIQGLMVRCGGELYALPTSMVERTVDPAKGRVEQRSQQTFLHIGSERMRLLPLCDRFRAPAAGTTPAEASRVLVLPTAQGSVGLVVDEVLGSREIVVRPLAAPLKGLRQYAGAALLEDGAVALVLDPSELASAQVLFNQ